MILFNMVKHEFHGNISSIRIHDKLVLTSCVFVFDFYLNFFFFSFPSPIFFFSIKSLRCPTHVLLELSILIF